MKTEKDRILKTIIINNLEWQAEDDGILRNWQKAVGYASSLGDRWRLPSIEELISLIDFNKFDPACRIENCRSSYYWSSSPITTSSNHAWNVYFYRGLMDYFNKDYHYYVRCVRDILVEVDKGEKWQQWI